LCLDVHLNQDIYKNLIMKFKIVYTSFVFLFALAFTPQLQATPTNERNVTINESQSFTDALVTKKMNKSGKLANRLNKLIFKAKKFSNKLAKKLDVNLDDPIMKWLWYGLFALGAAFILYVLSIFTFGFLSWFAYLASLASTACFVVWLLKYLELI